MPRLTTVHGLPLLAADHVLEPGTDLPGSPFPGAMRLPAWPGSNRQATMKLKTASELKNWAMLACIAMSTSPAFAQVSAGSSGASWLGNKAGIFYTVVSSIAGILMTTAWTLAGYKFIFVDGTKLTDLKGLLIGGLCCAGAATWSYTMLS